MKKLTAVLLSLVLVLCMAAPIASAVSPEELYPIIIVPGYSSSSLCYYDEDGTQHHVWGVEIDKIIGAILVNIAEIGMDIGDLAKGDAKSLGDTIGREFMKMFPDLPYDENGLPVTEGVVPYYTSPEKTNTKWLNENEDGQYIHEIEIMPYVSQYLGEKSEEWTFNFNTDFRQNSVDCAKDLDEYIESVCEYTGAEKVNILAVSHGGQTSATYLSLYGYKGRVNNAVLTVPAIGGAILAYDILADKMKFDEETLLYFLENGFMLEEDFNWLVKANELGFLDDFLHYFRPYAIEVLGTWGSIWDFVPSEGFEELSEGLSEQFKASEAYQKSIYFHEEILPNLNTLLKAAEGYGANIYLIAGEGWPSVVGSQVNSDAIITVNASTGATVAPFGQRFSDGYQTLGTTCDDPSHNHLSPGMEIDASTCYLPETTWFCKGLFHGMTLKDEEYSAKLMKMLVESDEHVTVHTYEAYPQFHDSMNVCESVYAEFDASVPGYISGSDKALVITNLSKKNDMQIVSVGAAGLDIFFSPADYIGKSIAPGESLTVPFTGSIPEASLVTALIKISFFSVGSLTPLNEKNVYFTVMNGEAPEYDEENPYSDLTKTYSLQDHIGGTKVGKIFEKYGLMSLLEVVFDIIYNLIGKYVFPIIEKVM